MNIRTNAKQEPVMARNNQLRESNKPAGNLTDETSPARVDMLAMTARVAEQSVDGFSSMLGVGTDAERAAQQYTRNVEVLQECSSAFGAGYQEISSECVNWAQGQLHANLNAFSRWMQCRTTQELLAVQSQLFGENIALILIANRRLAEVAKKMADRAAGKITEMAGHMQQAENRAA
jgi:hypothetical protein